MKIAIICSRGGHLTQIMQILSAFNGHDIFFVTYASGQLDAGDDEVRAIAPAYFLRNVGKRPHHILGLFLPALPILLREKPDVVFSTGSEIAMPFFFWAKLLGIKTLFLVTWSAVHQLPATGKFVYPLADEFWVQWPELLTVCGSKAKYFGASI